MVIGTPLWTEQTETGKETYRHAFLLAHVSFLEMKTSFWEMDILNRIGHLDNRC